MRLTALVLACSLAATPALAWGDYAHQLTGNIAWAQLNPRVRQEVRTILKGAAALDTPDCPMRSLAEAAYWPDCVRPLKDRFAFAAPWHYQNISLCEPFDIAAKCPDGNCVTAQIPRQLAIVADRKASPAARAQALAFFVHFMGDLHQPLHIGEMADKGGNDVAANYGAKAPPRMNLHRIWDSDLAERALTEPPAVNATSVTAAQRTQWAQGDVADWARESWEASRAAVYPGTGASCAGRGARPTIDPAYVAQATPVVRMRVEQAGTRIAMLLNRALAR